MDDEYSTIKGFLMTFFFKDIQAEKFCMEEGGIA